MFEVALLKRVELQGYPLKAGVCKELEVGIFICMLWYYKPKTNKSQFHFEKDGVISIVS